MKAVLMAGGFGTRIHPLTINLPKPMIPLVNRPIMEHIIDLLKRHGFTELVLLLYHQPDVIKNYFGDGSDSGIRITYVTPLEDYGTAGAVKAAARHLDERFMVISGDLLTDFDLGQALRFHEQKQARATIVLTPVPDPLQFGVVITDSDNRISKFLEKPGWGEVFSDTINTGIYILEPDVLDLIPGETNRDWAKDVFPAMLENGDALFGCPLDGYWADIGNTDAYLETCRDITLYRVEVQIAEQAVRGRDLRIGTDVQLSPQAVPLQEGLVVLGDNTQVLGKARLKNSIIGRNCIIEDGVDIEDAVIWDNSFIKEGARIHGAVIGQSVQVGRSATIEPGAVIGDETRIGYEAYLKKDVKVWPRKVIEPGATVTANLIWGEKWRRSLFEGAMVSGLTNVELTPEFMAKLGAAYGSSLPKDALILAGRDALHSSRMLKRSFVGGLLAAGVNVSDAQRIPLPVLRYQLATFREVGGVHFRQSPEDPAATEVIFTDKAGLDIPSGQAKGIERIFYKENFRRVHYSEPGGIALTPRLYHYYREAFARAVDRDMLRLAAPKVVVDLNHSPAGELLPGLLTDLGCDIIELNSHIHEGAGSTPQDEERALDQLARIVVTLEASAGFRLGPSGERLHIVNEVGEILTEIDALNILTALHCQGDKSGSIVLPVSAPQAAEDMAREAGLSVVRAKSDCRSLTEAALNEQAVFVASTDGRFAFPGFQPHFDALFTIAMVLELSAVSSISLRKAARLVPQRTYLHKQVPCGWELKGGIMRHMSGAASDLDATMTDGVRIHQDGDYLLVLPDQLRPYVHIIADTSNPENAEKLVDTWHRRIEAWKSELAVPLEDAG